MLFLQNLKNHVAQFHIKLSKVQKENPLKCTEQSSLKKYLASHTCSTASHTCSTASMPS
jgi:hypothetical protein